MANVNLKRFTNVDTLRAIQPDLLVRFLTPYDTFLQGRGVALAALDADALDYDGLIRAFMHPDDDTPEGLAEALYFIDEMSSPEAMIQLLDGAVGRKVDIDFHPDSTPGDVAIQIWLADRETVERKHAERFLIKPKKFLYFQTESTPAPMVEITDEVLKGLEQELDNWFEEKLRGRTSRVFHFPRGDETWFLVRHGDPYTRQGGIKDGESSSIFYRPETFDVAIYNTTLGEIRMKDNSVGINTLYRQQFGKHLFGAEGYFSSNDKEKYTLEPLRRDGSSCLVCSDIAGLEWVKLRELQFNWCGPFGEVETHRAKDLFASLQWRSITIPQGGSAMVQAKFEVKFTNVKSPRTVTIRPPNIASFTRDSDSVIGELWLAHRGFIVQQPTDEAAGPQPAPNETTYVDQEDLLA